MADNDHHIYILSMYARNGDLGAMIQTVNAFYIAPEVFNGTHKNTGYAIMHCAAEGGYIDVMNWLKARGASVNVKTSRRPKDEPIHFAAKYGKFEAMKWLKEQGADINAKNDFGYTPLHLAAGVYDAYKERGERFIDSTTRIEIAEWLIEQGADINAKTSTSDGTTPIYYAIRAGLLELAKLLKDNNADMKVTDKDGGTLMHTAAEYGKTRIMEWLKQEGFDINAKNNEGKTPLDMAITPLLNKNDLFKEDKEEAVEWLKRQMENNNAKAEFVNQQNAGIRMQVISYESYLKELGHTTDSVVEEMVPLENKIKSLQAELEEKKQKNDELTINIQKQSEEKIRLEKQL